MNNSVDLEQYYNEFTGNLEKWLPDGLVEADIALLERLNLLHYPVVQEMSDSALTRYFQSIESKEKLVLINDHYVIWIVPDRTATIPSTITFIALHKNNEVFLQLGFVNKGIYNNSQLILRLLEKFLMEIQDMEDALNQIAR